MNTHGIHTIFLLFSIQRLNDQCGYSSFYRLPFFTAFRSFHFATFDSDGLPCVRGVDYAAGESENILCFITRKDTRKAQQIRNSGNEAFAIDHDCPEWDDLQKLKFIKGTATAPFVEDPKDKQKVFGLLAQKFPFMENLPGDPSDFVGIKVEFKEVLVTNNTIDFAHTETVAY